MEMWTGRTAGRAAAADKLAALDGLTLSDIEVRQVPVACGEAITVPYPHQLAVAILPAYKCYFPVAAATTGRPSEPSMSWPVWNS